MEIPLRVLLIEDREDDEQLIRRALRRGGIMLKAFLRIQTRKELARALNHEQWDVIISDFSLPGFDGLGALEIVRQTGIDVPFIVVSGAVGEEVVVTTMKAGAHDYVMKDSLTRLVPAILRELEEAAGRRARRDAENEVRKLSRVVEQSPNIVVITDTDGNIEYVNPQYTISTGYAAEEVIGKHSRITRSGSTPPETYDELWNHLDHGKTWRGEISHRSKDGREFWVQATMTSIRDANGNITHHVFVQEDVTDRKLAEEAIQQSERRFRQLVEHAADAIFLHDYEGRIHDVNQQACDSLGYERSELLNTSLTEIVANADLPNMQAFWDTVTAGKPQAVSGHHRHKNGSLVPVEARVGLFEINNTQSYLALVRDVTERLALQEALRRYNEELEHQVAERTTELSEVKNRLEVILNNSADAIALLRPEGTIELANPAFCTLFEGREPANIAEVLENLQSNVGARLVAAIDKTFECGIDTRLEIVIPAVDSSTRDVDVTLTPIKVAEQDPGAIVMSMRDITHLKEIDRLKSRFVSNAAHDLASPITSLRMHLYSMKDSPENFTEYIAALEDQTDRLERLVVDLRTLSNLDQEQADFDMEAIDLHMLIDEVVMMHLPLAKRKQLYLDFIPCKDQPIVNADFNQLERVLVNLLTNALNYTPTGGIILSTKTENSSVNIHVRDTGIGIEPEAQSQIFDRFFRTAQARNSDVDGTGLGLAIVKEIVEFHGGRIGLQSTPGQGSTFTITLPLLQE